MSMNVALFKVTETAKLIAKVQGEEPQGELDGAVHMPDCFIVTTRFPDADWQPTSDPLTCGFCIERAGAAARLGAVSPRAKQRGSLPRQWQSWRPRSRRTAALAKP